MKKLPSLFSDRHMKRDKEHDELISELYRQIGRRNKPEAYHGGGRLAQKKPLPCSRDLSISWPLWTTPAALF